MKLYSVDLSPFASRARLAVYAKGLPIDVVAPEGGTKSPEYLALNPMGRVPCLATDDGVSIPESDTILEYLEDKFPERPLRPASAEDKARARLLARIGDLYFTGGAGLFGQMNPATRDGAAVDKAFADLDNTFSYLERFLGPGPYALGDKLTTADCSLAPLIFFIGVFGQAFARPNLLAGHPRLAAYAKHLPTDANVQKVYGEMQKALMERMAAPAS